MDSRDFINLGLLIAILAVLLFIAAVLMKSPRTDRDWKDALSKVAVFTEVSPGTYALPQLRAYTFDEGGQQNPAWGEITLNTDDLHEMWFFVEPFPSNRLFGHSFLSFVFDDGNGERKTVSVSIEARMEKGEQYSPLKGVFRNYELLYVWSTEKDILTRITVGLDHNLYAYKLDLEDDQIKKLFEYFVWRSNALADRPRFYNTLHSNCTNELAKAVNEAFPSALPWHRSWIMTGRSAKWLHKLGFVRSGPEEDFETLTTRADIQPFAKMHRDREPHAFANAWRAEFSTVQIWSDDPAAP